MDRRNFLKSLLGLAGTGVAVVALTPPAEAASLLDELAMMEAQGTNPLAAPLGQAEAEADLASPGAQEAQYYYYGPPPGAYRRRPRRAYRPPPRRRRICRTFYDEWGRLMRRCWWA